MSRVMIIIWLWWFPKEIMCELQGFVFFNTEDIFPETYAQFVMLGTTTLETL